MSTASTLAEAGLEIPAGYSVASYDERPDLDRAIDDLVAATWPAFMNEDEVANAHFGRAYADWPQFQTLLLDDAGTLVALGNAMPLAWDGTDEGLPDGLAGAGPPERRGSQSRQANEHARGDADRDARRPPRRAAIGNDGRRDAGRREVRRLPGGHRLCPPDVEGSLPARADRVLRRAGPAATACRSTRGSGSTPGSAAASSAPRRRR